VGQKMHMPPPEPPVSRKSQATVYHRWLREMRRLKHVQFVACGEWLASQRHSVFVRPVTLMGPHAAQWAAPPVTVASRDDSAWTVWKCLSLRSVAV
jgi:hypothetical protein